MAPEWRYGDGPVVHRTYLVRGRQKASGLPYSMTNNIFGTSLQFVTIRDRHCAQVVRTKAFCQRTEQASQSSKVWTDLGMIMGLEEDVKEHVLHKIGHTAKKYAQTMINVEPADKDDD
ncbi:uncharacterized protein LOC122379720 [Amphibalanus amphitrite]|uniref:uncharacterized protein LOC122379720 n=1 Tax=Amphibalanus amphitrite TaxID=1232801 RepID=UPI001C900C07|nr:uncharacterized protein LOC122379720 [Amphibalanus amphitrite]